MRYHPQGADDLRAMLDATGVASIEDLFRCIPERLRLRRPLDLPAAQSEIELRRAMGALAGLNADAGRNAWFLGAGAYNHYVPAAVGQLLLRSEFYTSYTPYQPEISQGTLQAIFEFQTLVAALTEMDVANASLYDGGSALAEAILMAQRALRRDRVIVSEAVHPHYVQVVRAYVRNVGLEVVTVPVAEDGRTDAAALAAALADAGERAVAVAVQSPNFFGCVEDLASAAGAARRAGALLVTAVAEPISMGLLHGPGRWGADVVVGEGQALGTPMSFGGPFLGFLATRETHLRQMPGRLVGEASDAHGNRGYVLTLATREQHIRREKATSNICTNQGLIALAATIYMSLMGRAGLREVALQCHSKAIYARRRLGSIPGCRARFAAPVFNEFVLDLPAESEALGRELQGRGIVGGLPLGRFAAGMERSMLIAVTEMNTRAEIDALAAALEELL